MGWFAAGTDSEGNRSRSTRRPALNPFVTRSGHTHEAHRRQSADAPRRLPLPPSGRPVRRRRRAGRRRAPGWRASSGSSSRAGTSTRPPARSSSSTDCRGSTRPSASIRTTRRTVDDAGWAEIARARAPTSGSSRSGETGLDYDRLFSPIGASSRTSGETWRWPPRRASRRSCTAARRPDARDAQDALLAELRRFGSEPPRVIDPLVLGSASTTRRRCSNSGP